MEDGVNCSKKIGGEDLKKRCIAIVSAVLVVLTLIAIWRFSAQDAGESSALSGKITQLVAELPWLTRTMSLDVLDHIVRKFAHGSIYLILGISLTGTMITQKTKLIVWMVPLIGIVLAMMDEFHQSFVPGRGPSLRDVLIDALGVCLGMLVMLGLRRCYRHWRMRLSKNPS